MFSKSKESIQQETSIVAQTIIAEGITFKDNIICGSGNVSVKGVHFGDIDIDGYLLIGESGNVRGGVRAATVHVHGILEGDIVVQKTIRIFSGGKVNGDVNCGVFIVDEGAVFGGRCNMDAEISPKKQQRQERPENETLTTPLEN